MSQIIIDIGAAPDDGLGTPLRTAFSDINLMFTEIYAAGPVGSNVAIANNTITTTAINANLVLSPSGIGKIQVNNAILPRVDDVYDLGGPTLRWNSVYIGSGGFTTDGNITADYFIGNGSLLTGISATTSQRLQLGNSEVYFANTSGPIVFRVNSTNAAIFSNTSANFSLPLVATSTISAVGNVTAPYFIGNVVGNISSPGSNTQILFNDGGVIVGNASLTFNKTTGLLSVATISAVGNVTASGNVFATYFLGNGACLTGVITSVANINNGTSNINIAAANANATVSINGTSNVVVFANTGEFITGVLSVSSNITGGNIATAGLVTATGNVTSSANVAGGNLVASGIATATGNIVGGNLTTVGIAILEHWP